MSIVRKTYGDGNLPIFDEKTALMYSDDNREMLLTFARDFLEQKPHVAKKITDAFAESNWHDYTIFVHGLKSSSMSLGGKKVSAAAKAMEQVGKEYESATDDAEREQKLAYIKEHHLEILRLYDEFADELKKITT